MTAEKFLDYVERSCLIEEDQLVQTLSALKKSEPRAFDDSESLADCLIHARLLSRWQCDNLLQGKYKSFHLGHFRLMDLLGFGNSSSVYLGDNTIAGTLRAIKVLPEKRVEESSYLARFRQEAILFGRLNHPNIVQAIDVGQQGKWLYIVMEHVDGRDLQTIVEENGPLGPHDAVEFIRQIVDGLEEVHRTGFAYCRVNPSKITLTPAGTVKLLCTSAAEPLGDEFSLIADAFTSMVSGGDQNATKTADFLAPELVRGGSSADPRADIYGLGCTLYYLLTGQPPFLHRSLEDVYLNLCNTPESILRLRPETPKDLVELCGRMMNPLPDARPQTAKEVATAWLVYDEE